MHFDAWGLGSAMVLGALVLGCEPPRAPRGSIERVLEGALYAVERRDALALWEQLDAAARGSMCGVTWDRRAAAELIRRSYPEARQAAALAELGDAVHAQDCKQLFAMRCDEACFSAFEAALQRPREVESDGDEARVHGAGGATLTLRRVQGAWGIAWNDATLAEEALDAGRDLLEIRASAEVYERQRTLDAPLHATP